MPREPRSKRRRRRAPAMGGFGFSFGARWEVGLPVALLGAVIIAYSWGAPQAGIGLTVGAVVLVVGLALLFLLPSR